MAEINQEVTEEPARPPNKPQRPSLDLEEEDNMTSFIEVHLAGWAWSACVLCWPQARFDVLAGLGWEDLT